MSGGHFDYKQYQLTMLAEEIEQEILDQRYADEDYRYSKKTIKKFKKAVKLLNRTYVYVQRIDYLVSSDDGEEDFHSRIKDELNKLKK